MTRKDEPSLIDKLTDYYEEKKIRSTNFHCRYFERCRQGMCLTPEKARSKDEIYDTFTPAKSALVGKHYEHTTPRLLFISSDPGSAIYSASGSARSHSFASRQSRTPESLQCHPKFELHEMNPHWRYTHEMAHVIYEKCSVLPRRIRVEDTLDYFAHANTVKCSVNKRGDNKNKRNKGEAPSRLFNNCRWYLRGEIDVLSPDVIITQGKRAREGVMHAFQEFSVKWGIIQTINLSNGKQVLWLPIYHPGYGGFHTQRKKEWGSESQPWIKFAQRVRDFVSRN